MIFTQDGNQRCKTPKEWPFAIPDSHGRVVLTGTCTNTPNVSAINNAVVYATYPESGSGAYLGYTLSGVSLSGYTILSATYYDHYKFRSLAGFNNSQLANESSGISSNYLTRYGVDASTYEHKGLLTGTATALLNGSATPTYLYATMYYDNRGRVIQTKSTNHLSGGIEKEYVAYNFVGQPISRTHIHSATNKTTQTQVYTYAYDHAGRLLTTKHKLNSGTEITLVNHVYDNLGRLISNKRNGNTNLTTNYSYNIRSWMKSITTGNLFSQTLYYNESYGNTGNKPRYNGNISAMTWTMSGSSIVKGYKFSYDELSRLKSADYMENAAASNHHNTSYAYDKQGNITRLIHNGHTGTSTYGTIDDLTLTYNGNQLTRVVDTGVVPSLSSSADFRSNPSNPSIAYFYDANGNLKQDLNKGISSIAYNSLNLPRSLTISNSLGSATNTYVYAADGTKLSVTKGSFKTDYVGNAIYENGMFKRLLVDGGYYEGSTYYFYITDHLGNNRVVANQNAGVVQSTQYYPFGMAFADGTGQSVQPYKYNGKELDGDKGLNLYDYSARYMDGTLGRFTTVDPLAEKYYSISPYAYVANNPMKFIDPDGREMIGYTIDEKGYVKMVNLEGGREYDVLYKADSYSSDKQKDYDETGQKTGLKIAHVKKNQERNNLSFNLIGEDGKTNKVTNHTYEISSSTDLDKIVDFLEGYNIVEVADIKMENPEGKQINLMMTSHERETVRGTLNRLHKYATQGYGVENFNHTHPDRPIPSPGDKAIVPFIKAYSKNPKFNIRFKGREYPYK